MRKTTNPVSIIAPKPWLRITPSRRKELRAKRDAWLREIDPTDLFRLFDTMPDTQFFAKNRQGEVMFWCDAVRKAYQIRDEADVIGLTNFDAAPAGMAQIYAHGDARVCATGKPLLNQVELCFDDQGMPDWFLVNKIPIHSRSGRCYRHHGLCANLRRTRPAALALRRRLQGGQPSAPELSAGHFHRRSGPPVPDSPSASWSASSKATSAWGRSDSSSAPACWPPAADYPRRIKAWPRSPSPAASAPKALSLSISTPVSA